MTDQTKRPTFVECFLEDLQDQYRSGGMMRLAPLYGLGFLLVGAFVAWMIPDAFWTDSWADGHRDVSTAVYAVAVTFNGLLLTMSWGAFSKIHEMIGSHRFCRWLKQHKMLHHYIFVVDFVQLWQLIALLASFGALFSLLLDTIPTLAHRCILAGTLASSAYAIRWAVGAVQIMHDVVWYKALFEEQEEEAAMGGSVLPFPTQRV